MRLVDRLLTRATPAPLSLYDWNKMFRPGASVAYQGNTYQAYRVNSGASVAAAPFYDSNSVVFACEANRLLLFSEARFQFQQIRKGRPGDLFGTEALSVLEEPWPGHSTRDLLGQAELDVMEAGNSYWVRDPQGLLRLAPAKVKIITEAATENLVYGQQVGERLLAYVYIQDPKDPKTWTTYPPEDVGHYMPYPDRCNRFIGTSWLSACLPDIEADVQFTEHKTAATSNGAQLGYVVSLDKEVTPEQFKTFVQEFRANHEGAENAGKTLFLGGGADVKTVGQTFENLSLRATQGSGETRVAACAGVPPVIVGLSEGLASATYSNYGQARRRLVDGTMRPLWGAFASSMQSLVDVPTDARLWYDDRDIPFLREDVADQVAILKEQALTIESYVRAGFEPETAVLAATTGDPTVLVHTGLFSVQLQPPSEGSLNGNQPVPATNGAKPKPAAN